MSEPTAYVKVVDGQVVLVDPAAAAVFEVVQQHNLGATVRAHGDRIAHFARRIVDLGRSPRDVLIVLLCVDDLPLGRALADALMPGHDWQAYRDAGAVPFARGLAGREGLQGILDKARPEAGERLRSRPDSVMCLVVDHGAALVFEVSP